MKKIKYFIIFICLFLLFVGCGKEEKDYGQYLNKIWIMKETTSKDGLISTPFSFCITSIDNKTIEGKFQLGGAIALPEYYSDNSLLYPEELGTFKGSITNGRAQCTFEDKRGDSGELEIIFKGDNCLEVAINIKSIRDSVEELELKEVNTFSPYNIKDIRELDISKEWSFEIELDSWGQVNFVSGKVENPDGRYFPVSYLTNPNGDILYEFHPGYLAGSEISEVSVEDINGDGLKDISITTLFTCYDAEDDYAIKWDSFQIENGCFYLNKRSDITEGREQKNEITPRDKHIYNSTDADKNLLLQFLNDEIPIIWFNT